jgi:hypothetical protein
MEKMEQEVVSVVRSHHLREVRLVQGTLAHVTRGLQKIEGLVPDHPLQEVTYVLTVNCLNSLFVSLKLATQGWYVQSLANTRYAYELALSGTYLSCFPEKASAMKEQGAKWPRPRSMLSGIARSFGDSAISSKDFRKALDWLYSHLSQFTHPSFASLASVMEGEGRVRLGPFYNENHFHHCIDAICRVSSLSLGLIAEVYPTLLTDTAWYEQLNDLRDRHAHWLQDALNQYGMA